MPLLTTVEAVRQRLDSTSKLGGVNIAMEETLLIVTRELERILRTNFIRQTVTDTFWVSNSRLNGNRFSTTLLTSRGLLDSGQAVTVNTQGTRKLLVDEPKDLEAQSGVNFVRIDHERGLIVIDDFKLKDAYVEVSYTSGLNIDTDVPPHYLAVPEWLGDLAVQLATVDLSANPALFDLKEGEKREDLKIMSKFFNQTVADRIRYYPGSHRPL